MFRTISLLLIGLSGVTAQANSTFDLTLRDESISFRFNANELRCDPGHAGGFEVDTTIQMDVPNPMFDPDSNGRRFISSNISSVTHFDKPGSCDKIAHLINQPNPNWRLADARRLVKERYYQVSNARCDKSLVEELTITIQGEPDLKFTSTYGFFVESLPVSRCSFNVEK